MKDGERQYLDMTLFKDAGSSETESMAFCNWNHLINWARQMLEYRKPFYFVTLPYVKPKSLAEFIVEFKP